MDVLLHFLALYGGSDFEFKVIAGETEDAKVPCSEACTTGSEASVVLQCHGGFGEMPQDSSKD